MKYENARAAIDWLREAFGFVEHMVVPGEGDAIRHAQLRFEGGMVMLGTAMDDDWGKIVKVPRAVGGVTTQSPYIIVEDVDAHYARAVAAGAEIVVDVQDEPHGRGYSCRDPEGHLWNFGSYDPWA